MSYLSHISHRSGLTLKSDSPSPQEIMDQAEPSLQSPHRFRCHLPQHKTTQLQCVTRAVVSLEYFCRKALGFNSFLCTMSLNSTVKSRVKSNTSSKEKSDVIEYSLAVN
eukprot:1095605-Amphidinium_carterae.1